MKLLSPTRDRLQQGTVFSCCAVAGYEGCDGWGVVITARCDLANFKAPVLNYLPVVSLDDWLNYDGLGILRSRCIAETEAEVSGLLADLNAPDTILLATPIPEAFATLIAQVDERKQKALLARAEKLIAKSIAAHSPAATVKSLRTAFPKLYAPLIRELMTHRLAGHYYLCRVEPEELDSCYVVLLRQIGAMPSVLASCLPFGMCRADAQAKSPRSNEFLTFRTATSMAIPLGVIPSPNIEHLLQSFSLLFGRIGLPDPDPVHIGRFASPEAE